MVHHRKMKAYSIDLREKIVAAVLGRGMSKAQAARTFGVGATSVKRYMMLAEEGKSLSPGKAPGKKGKLGRSGMDLLEEDLRTRPAVTYQRRADLLYELLGVRVSKSTICRMVRRLGYTRKKDRWVLQKEMNGSERLGELR
jgi:transposase